MSEMSKPAENFYKGLFEPNWWHAGKRDLNALVKDSLAVSLTHLELRREIRKITCSGRKQGRGELRLHAPLRVVRGRRSGKEITSVISKAREDWTGLAEGKGKPFTVLAWLHVMTCPVRISWCHHPVLSLWSDWLQSPFSIHMASPVYAFTGNVENSSCVWELDSLGPISVRNQWTCICFLILTKKPVLKNDIVISQQVSGMS